MYIDSDDGYNIGNISNKETYTAEEKQIIMNRLNEERLIYRNAEKTKSDDYSDKDKAKILNKLNNRRLSVQKREEIKKKRTDKKKIYKFATKEYYKFLHMEREYYIEIEDIKKISSRPEIITLYYKTFNELQKKDVLIKVEIYSDKFFISRDAIRVYFKSHSLEDDR